MASFHRIAALEQDLEIAWISPRRRDDRKDTLVFLHEGLGSIQQWKSFPQQLCDDMGLPGLAYCRQGYGQSSLRQTPADTHFMHHEAQVVLPCLLKDLGIQHPILIGHSDGASIALLYAALAAQPPLIVEALAGKVPTVTALVVIAPHLFVEPHGVASISLASTLFEADAGFRERLGRYHQNVRHTFGNWSQVWLSPEFASWNIEAETASITCPVLAIQGCQDQYGSLEQIRSIRRLIGAQHRVDLLEIEHCKHSPHLEQAALVLKACKDFLKR